MERINWDRFIQRKVPKPSKNSSGPSIVDAGINGFLSSTRSGSLNLTAASFESFVDVQAAGLNASVDAIIKVEHKRRSHKSGSSKS